MEPEPTQYRKRLLCNIECTNPMMYVLSRAGKLQLDYPPRCLEEPDRSIQRPLIAIDCQMVQTTNGEEAVSITIVDSDQKVLLHECIRPTGMLIDLRTDITGLKAEDLMGYKKTLEEVLSAVRNAVEGMVLVGHDLCNDMKVLPLSHQYFIDTVALFPHRDKLPAKTKLRDLSLNFLKQPIQYGKHDPVEDATAALRLAKWHIAGGRGTVEHVPASEVTPMTLEDICGAAQLDPAKVVVLILRGSQANGLVDKESDFDYVMAYDTSANIDGALITLFNVDIAFYDIKSFMKLVNDQDISIRQIFTSGKQYHLRNLLTLPSPDLTKLRQSTTFHVYRSLNKSRRRLRQGHERKALKSIHTAFRFYDYYDQLAEHGDIVDYRRKSPLWLQMKKEWQDGTMDFIHLHAKWMAAIDQFGTNFRKKYPTIKRAMHGEDEATMLKSKHRKEKLKNTAAFERQDLPEGELNLQHYLLENGFDYIEEDYRVRVQRHCLYPNILQFHYLQSADFSKRIVCESRGVILDSDDRYKVVAFPYFKFFDYNDKHCHLEKFEWKDSELFEKLDGSTATLYFYRDSWHVASSNKPDGAGDYCFASQQTTTSFSKQFWRVFYKLQYRLPTEQDRDKTFIFELLSTNHLIVVNHKTDRLILHGCRHIPSLKELPIPPYHEKYRWEVIQTLKLDYKCIEDVVTLSAGLDPHICQGFILKDRNNMRVKIKSPQYLLLSWVNPLNNNIITDKSLLEIIVRGEHESFVKYCPEWRKGLERLLNPLEQIKRFVFDRVQRIPKEMSERQFAQLVRKQDPKLHPLFFSARKGDLTQENFYAALGAKKLSQLLECKQESLPLST